VGIVLLQVFPAFKVQRALIIETKIQIWNAPAQAIAERHGRDFPKAHFLITMGALGLFLSH
jgi:hypothetical protein